MKKIEIDDFKPLYQEEIVNLILEIQREEFGIEISRKDQPDLDDIASFYQSGNGNFWVAKVNGEIVGTIALLDIGNKNGALRKMFVKSAFRGKDFGVGQTLLNTVFEWAKQKNFSKILLGTTEKFLAAQRFYEKNGFAEINKNLLPAEFPIMKVDVKFYEYSL